MTLQLVEGMGREGFHRRAAYDSLRLFTALNCKLLFKITSLEIPRHLATDAGLMLKQAPRAARPTTPLWPPGTSETELSAGRDPGSRRDLGQAQAPERGGPPLERRPREQMSHAVSSGNETIARNSEVVGTARCLIWG